MKTPRLVVLLLFALTAVQLLHAGSATVPFTATALARKGNTFVVCGTELGIASSSDGGVKWEVQNLKPDGGTLLSIGWANEDLGFAGGTSGIVLLTTDGGSHWKQLPVSFSDPVLQVSFSDPQHGIVVTSAVVLYTKDGGVNWKPVLPSGVAELATYNYVLAAVVLDERHAAVLLKEGPAQYYSQYLYTTSDSGDTWKVSDIEHTTLNNLLVVSGEYWLVGTEVIDREIRGGHAVAVAFHSHDGVNWDRGPRSPNDTNYACRPEGCLMWNGAWFNPFEGKGTFHTFPTLQGISSQWSATNTRICSLGVTLQCAEAKPSVAFPQEKNTPPAPQLVASELRATTSDMAGKCIRCQYPQILISNEYSGKASVDFTITVRRDGTVSSVELLKSPNTDIGAQITQAARSWVFHPLLQNGAPVAVKRKVSLMVMVIKP